MAVPKRRTSKSVKHKRRTHDSLNAPNIPRGDRMRAGGSRSQKFFCHHCNRPKAPHTICGNCGHYRGKSLIEVER